MLISKKRAYFNHACFMYTKSTGKSFSEALILASTNPQYDKRLFIDSRVQYMKTTSLEHVVYTNCFFVFVYTFRTISCTQHVLGLEIS